MVSKTRELSDRIDQIIELVDSGLPDKSVGIKNLDTKLQYAIWQEGSHNVINGYFIYDTNSDGLADGWVLESGGTTPNLTTTIEPKTGSGYLHTAQRISVDSIGEDAKSFVKLSQIFPRNFSGNTCYLSFLLWVGGTAAPTVFVTVKAKTSLHEGNNGPDTEVLISSSFRPTEIEEKEHFFIKVEDINDTSTYLEISFSMEGGPGGPDGSHSFTVGAVSIFTNKDLLYKFQGKDQKIFSSTSPKIMLPSSDISYLNLNSKSSPIVIVPEIGFSDGENVVSEASFQLDKNFVISQGNGHGKISLKSQPFLWQKGSTALPASVLVLGDGIEALRTPSQDSVTLSIDSKIFHFEKGIAFLAVSPRDIFLNASDRSSIERSAIWFGSPVSYTGEDEGYDSKKKIVRIGKENQKTNYLVTVAIDIADEIINDGFIRVFFHERESDGESKYLIDVNGNPVAVQMNYIAFDTPKQIVLAGIVSVEKPTEISLHIVSSFPEGARIASPMTGSSALLIQSLDSAIDLVPSFENYTNTDLHWFVRSFKNPLSSMEALLKTPLPAADYDVFSQQGEKNIFAEDGYVLTPMLNPVKGEIKDNTLFLSDTEDGFAPYFSFGYYFGQEETVLLRGSVITGALSLLPDNYPGFFMIVSWNGTGPIKEADNPIVGENNEEPALGKDWVIVQKTDVPGLSTFEQVSAAVPNDARILAVLFCPSRAVKPVSYEIRGVDVTVAQEFTGAIIRYAKTKDEIGFHVKTFYERFIQIPPVGRVYRYTINDTDSPCPVGELRTKGLHIPVVLDESVNQVPGSTIKAGEGGIKFNQDMGDVKIQTTVQVYAGENAPAGSTVPVTFIWYKVVADDFVPVENGKNVVEVIQGKPQVSGIFSLYGSFKRDDILVLRMKTTGKDFAYLQSSNPHIPLIENILTQESLGAT